MGLRKLADIFMPEVKEQREACLFLLQKIKEYDEEIKRNRLNQKPADAENIPIEIDSIVNTVPEGTEELDRLDEQSPAQESAEEVREDADIIKQFFGSVVTRKDVASRLQLMWGFMKHPAASENLKQTITAELGRRKSIFTAIFERGGQKEDIDAIALLENIMNGMGNIVKSEEKVQTANAIGTELTESLQNAAAQIQDRTTAGGV